MCVMKHSSKQSIPAWPVWPRSLLTLMWTMHSFYCIRKGIQFKTLSHSMKPNWALSFLQRAPTRLLRASLQEINNRRKVSYWRAERRCWECRPSGTGWSGWTAATGPASFRCHSHWQTHTVQIPSVTHHFSNVNTLHPGALLLLLSAKTKRHGNNSPLEELQEKSSLV